MFRGHRVGGGDGDGGHGARTGQCRSHRGGVGDGDRGRGQVRPRPGHSRENSTQVQEVPVLASDSDVGGIGSERAAEGESKEEDIDLLITDLVSE